MILCKSAVDRGFAHGTLYKTDTVDLRAEKRDSAAAFHPDTRKPRSAIPLIPTYACRCPLCCCTAWLCSGQGMLEERSYQPGLSQQVDMSTCLLILCCGLFRLGWLSA